MRMSEAELSERILFAKEAAAYLGISVQRLNQLVHEKKIQPLKKTSAGTLFLVDELDRRKRELEVFMDAQPFSGTISNISVLSPVHQEAINYATLLNLTNQTESTLEPRFNELGKQVDLASPMLEHAQLYADHFGLQISQVRRGYEVTLRQFQRLKESDRILKRGQSEYPQLLARTEQAPRFLYARGNLDLLQNRIVSIVGSRQASDAGRKKAYELARILGMNGVTIASGLARGIDTAAHRSALENGFNTIAVIGTDLNRAYPAKNEDLQERITESGLVITQFSPASKVQRWHFPLRNGVMSGISLATVIVEASETSGALKQADFTLKQGRLLLIPKSAYDNPNIAWPRKYAERKGAYVVRTSTEIVERLTEYRIFAPSTDPMPDESQQLSLLEG